MSKGKFSMDKGAFTRYGLLLLAVVNQSLQAFGYETLPVAEGDAETLLSLGFTVVAGFVAAYKDNPVTEEAKHKKAQ